MTTQGRIRRRDFLAATPGVMGLGALAVAANPLRSVEAVTGAADAKPDRIEGVLAMIESKSDQFVVTPRDDGKFLTLLIRLARSKRVLEIGTAHGYASLWLCRGLADTGGRLTTMEIMEDRVVIARKHLTEAGVSGRVTFLTGNAHEQVAGLKGPFDLVLLSADKDGNLDYFRKLHPKQIASGGLLLAYRAIQRKSSMQDFLEAIGAHPDYDAMLLSLTMEDGYSVAMRRRA